MSAERLRIPVIKPSADIPAVALVVGEELSALGAVRSLTAAGVPCFVTVSDSRRDTMRSRYGIKVPIGSYVDEALLDPLEELARRLAMPVVLLPTNDDAAATISRHRDRLADRFRFCLPPHDLLSAMARKKDFQDRAEALGCPVPRAVHLTGADDLPTIAGLTFPCIVKPGCRNHAYDARFAKAYLMDQAGPAVTLVRRLLDTLPDIMVQEYIAGPNENIYFCLQYRDAHGRVPASFTGRKLRSLPPDRGITASCIAAPEMAEELDSLTERFFGATGAVGLCSMEFKLDANRARVLMVEPTVGRINWQEEIATLNGVNLPYVAWRDLAGLPPLPCPVGWAEVGWRNSFAHWHPSWLRRHGAARFPRGTRVVDAHWRLDDPMPALAEAEFWLRRHLMKLFGAHRGV